MEDLGFLDTEKLSDRRCLELRMIADLPWSTSCMISDGGGAVAASDVARNCRKPQFDGNNVTYKYTSRYGR